MVTPERITKGTDFEFEPHFLPMEKHWYIQHGMILEAGAIYKMN